MLDAVGTTGGQRAQGHRLAIDVWVYARRNPAIRPALAELSLNARQLLADDLERMAASAGLALPVPATDIALIIDALDVGVYMRHVSDPDHIPADSIQRLLALLIEAWQALSRERQHRQPLAQADDKPPNKHGRPSG
jgi:transcriptional regulator BetI-like protein